MVAKIIALLAFALVFAALGAVYFKLPEETKIVERTIVQPPEIIYKTVTVEKNVTITEIKEIPIKNYTPKVATFHGVGVYENVTKENAAKGELVNMTLSLVPGDGRILVDSTERTYGQDFQDDLLFIKDYAEYYTGENLSHYDLVWRVDSNAKYVEGVSGSAAMGVALISLIQNRTIVPNVVMTGVLMADGSVGRVDGLDSKITVADSLGLEKIFVPEEQCVTDKNVTIQIICIKDITTALGNMTV